LAVVGRADAIHAVREVDRMHTIDADQQYAFDLAMVRVKIG
jgi:hypothetical protein